MISKDGNFINVSAIVPVRNGSAWLGECLDSLLNQQLSKNIKFQVSIYDDGSIDDTMQLALSYRSKFESRRINFIFSSDKISRG
ncbi:unnamed protein product [Anisakis simplex]|uniref:Glyco_trans_2-like domain-containing protein n=1 Tax=Anisakis simplex TaxID=6269 RepID=A0A0M3JDV1_ANISI|nr:unnamed protein product [Anisakis simplex]